jgi:hypothetical protein
MEFAIWVLITLVTLALVGLLFAPMVLLGVLDLKVPAALSRAPWIDRGLKIERPKDRVSYREARMTFSSTRSGGITDREIRVVKI